MVEAGTTTTAVAGTTTTVAVVEVMGVAVVAETLVVEGMEEVINVSCLRGI
jgi:hypothetical protein